MPSHSAFDPQGVADVGRTAGLCYIEDETRHSTGFHVLRAGPDVYMRKVSSRKEWYEFLPNSTLEIEWCYGDKNHPQHWVPIGQLTKGNGTRCAEYTGFFE
jgi:hypothetical protein